MTEQENASTNGQPTEKLKKPKVNRGPFASPEEAQPHKPAEAKFKLYRVVAPDGSVSFAWTTGPYDALHITAKAAGWTASEHGKAPTKEKVAGLLGQLTPEDRAVLIAQYVPAPDKATGKGKGGK